MVSKGTRVPPEVEDVANQIGEFIEYWGFKNVHGRLWAHLFLSPCPLDAGELIERLSVSKALVSMSISDLLEYEVIQLAGKSERGTTLYKANCNVTGVITGILRKRERRMLSRVSSAVRLLKTLPDEGSNACVKISESKVDALSDLIQSAELSLDAILQMSETSFSCLSRFTNIETPIETK